MIRNLTFVVLLAVAFAAQGAEQNPPAIEAQVKQIVDSKDVIIVHFWAPWCGNCIAEQRDDGWANFIARNPAVRFVFIEIWNDGKDSRESLAKYNIGAQPNLMLLADPRPRRGDARMRTFMDLPVTWTPTTWVFREGRQLFAFNYGEVRFPILQQLVDDAAADW